jgi:hypothetical protein
MHCGNSDTRSGSWVHIGSQDLIEKRGRRVVPLSPYGVLNDYVPFYFTPFSPMLKNIHTGWNGLIKRDNEEIVILVSSLHKVRELNLDFLFTDRHAYHSCANFFSCLSDVDKIDWTILQRRDFRRDPDDPAKFERYQAEALVYRMMPVEGLIGVICYHETLKRSVEVDVQERGLNVSVHARPGWYFA